jgi:hypothetical protein
MTLRYTVQRNASCNGKDFWNWSTHHTKKCSATQHLLGAAFAAGGGLLLEGSP